MTERLKAERIFENEYSDWNKLIYEHPEISLVRNKSHQLIGVRVPETAISITSVILDNRVYTLEYFDTSINARIRYISPRARNSILYELINS